MVFVEDYEAKAEELRMRIKELSVDLRAMKERLKITEERIAGQKAKEAKP